jgi:hypothetical protein
MRTPAQLTTVALGLVALLAPPPALAAKPAAAPEAERGCGKLSLVQAWSGNFSLSVNLTDTRPASPGAAGLENRHTWNLGGKIALEPVIDEGQRRENRWIGEPQAFGGKVRTEHRPLGGDPATEYRIISEGTSLVENQNVAALQLDCANRTYRLDLTVGELKLDQRIELSPALKAFCKQAKGASAEEEGGALAGQMVCALVEGQQEAFEKRKGTFGVSVAVEDRPFDPDKPILSGSGKFGSSIDRYDLTPIQVDLSWSVSPGKESPAELVFDIPNPQGYEDWLPAPKPEDAGGVRYEGGAPMVVTVKLQPKKAGEGTPKGRIDFTLEDVSRHAGRCNNFPRDLAAKDDLRFAEKQPDERVVVDGPKAAHTKVDVSEVRVAVEATDTGASGRLKATCEKLSLKAEYKPTGKTFLAIPKDDDDNHVADGWEKKMGVGPSHPADWDEDDQPSGQKTKGDGIGLYGEYRGFVVLEDGQRVHKRTNPLSKEIFVIDDKKILDRSRWKAFSGIDALEVDDTLTRAGGDPTASRIVDYRGGEGVGGHKYAVRLSSVPGMMDSDCRGELVLGCTQWAAGACPRTADYAKVFPDRIRNYIFFRARWLQVALEQPDSPQGQALAKSGLPRWLAERALEQFGETAREGLARQLVTLVAIHEVGHACGLPGHLHVDEESGKEVEGSTGEKACTMRYQDQADKSDFSILQSLFKPEASLPGHYGAFCRAGPTPCFPQFNVKD